MTVDRKELQRIMKASRIYKKYSTRTEFDLCNASNSREAIIDILKKTGDKKAAEEEIDHFLDLMLRSCNVGTVKGAMIVGTQGKSLLIPQSDINSWVCYLKTCTQREVDMDYYDCMKDEKRKEELYDPKKDYWKKEAKKGCPEGE